MKWRSEHKRRIRHHTASGPWSGHVETIEWSLEVEIEGDRFTLVHECRVHHEASNRGRTTTETLKLAGEAAALRGGYRLAATTRIQHHHSLYEPAEDMWTPDVSRESTRPPGELPEAERVVLRAHRRRGSRLELAKLEAGPAAQIDLKRLTSKPLSAVRTSSPGQRK